MNISYSFARNFLRDTASNNYLYENEVHIHAPDGAQKKEGSTDSLSIASALISLGKAFNKLSTTKISEDKCWIDRRAYSARQSSQNLWTQGKDFSRQTIKTQ
jgi:hypothetical protein